MIGSLVYIEKYNQNEPLFIYKERKRKGEI